MNELLFIVSLCAAPNGDGSAEHPFNSPVAARDALRQADRRERAVVKFAPGTYELPEGFELDARDHDIVFQGGGGVRFTRSVAATPGGKVACDAPPAPDAEYCLGTMRPHAPMFFYDHKWAQCARWPKTGWATFSEAVDSGLRSRCLSGILPDAPAVAGSFKFDDDRPARWNFENGVYLAGYWTHDWSFECLRAAGFDAETHVMTLAGAAKYGLATGTWSEEKGRRFYAYNVREELSDPGEYYYDRKTGVVEFIPPKEGVGEFRAAVTEGPVVSLSGARDIVFDGITVEYAAGDGFRLENCERVVVRDSQIRNVGGTGVVINGGRNCEILRATVADCGFCGTIVNGGDRKTLTRCDHLVADCVISGFGRICRCYAPGARVGGVGVTVRGCTFFDAPHSAVIYGGNDHLFAENEVHDIMRETGDAGAFYTGRDPTSRGNVLLANYVHDIGRPDGTAVNTMAFYIDDCDAGDSLISNRVKNVARGLMLGGGHDNHIVGNTFENCRIGMSIDARGVVWNDRWDSPTDKSWQMTRKVQEMKVDEEPWRSRYPLLATYLADGPREPRHIEVVGNKFVNCRESICYSMKADEYRHLFDMRGNTIE